MIKWKPDCRSRKQKRKNNPALWLVYSSASASDSDNLVFTWSWAERKCRSRKRSRKKMEPFWFFWLRFRCAYDSAYDSDFWFSLGHKRSYDSDSDSDSVASENQPLCVKFERRGGNSSYDCVRLSISVMWLSVGYVTFAVGWTWSWASNNTCECWWCLIHGRLT